MASPSESGSMPSETTPLKASQVMVGKFGNAAQQMLSKSTEDFGNDIEMMMVVQESIYEFKLHKQLAQEQGKSVAELVQDQVHETNSRGASRSEAQARG